MQIKRIVIETAVDVPSHSVNGRAIDTSEYLPCPTCGARWSIQVNDGLFACGSQCHKGWCFAARRESERREKELIGVITRTLPVEE